jgi:hypothetical protein
MKFILSCTRGLFLLSRAKREIPELKKPDNYFEKFYTGFSEGKLPDI